MAKKTHYLYGDFETLKVPMPKVIRNKQWEDKYKNFNEYYKKENDPKFPEVYDWNVGHDPKYKIPDSKHMKNILDENGEVEYRSHTGLDIFSFIDWVSNLKVDAIIYFNNLMKFDGHFLVPALDKAGYKVVYPFEILKDKTVDKRIKEEAGQRVLRIRNFIMKSNPKIKDVYYKILEEHGVRRAAEYMNQHIQRRWKTLLPDEYSVLTNGDSAIYEIKIGLPDLKTTKGVNKNRAVIIRDNLLLFPTSIKAAGELVAEQHINNGADKKTMKEKYHKKELKGGYNRSKHYKNYEELEKDGNQLDYLVRDTFILYSFHKLMEKYFPRKHWKMTIASTSYKEWLRIVGETYTDNLIKAGVAVVKKLERGAKRIIYKNKTYTTMGFKKMIINKIIPVKWLDRNFDTTKTVMWNKVYQWYSAGLVHVNEAKRGQYVENLTVMDKNSSFPASMDSDHVTPVGVPHTGDSKDHPFKFYELRPKKKIYNKVGLPFLFDKTNKNRAWSRVLLPNRTYKFTSTTLPNFLKYYPADEADYELKVIMCFKQQPMSKLFSPFIRKWYKIKVQAKKDGNVILALLAKLFLNSVYGKFGTSRVKQSRIWDPHNQMWVATEKEVQSKYYLPVGINIAEDARMSLVEVVKDHYEDFVYCDTDSVFTTRFKGNYDHVNFHPTDLGAWDIELDGGFGLARRPKQYLFLSNTPDKKHKGKFKYKIALSGINFNKYMESDSKQEMLDPYREKIIKEVSLVDYVQGKTITDQNIPFRVMSHGVIIQDIEKKILPLWDEEYKKNVLPEQLFFNKEHFMDTLEKVKKLPRNTI